jgi:hypothetical protein
MTLTKRFSSYALLTVAALVLAACANQMEPAKKALDGIDSAISAASADAGKYVPDQLSGVQTKLAALKTAFDNKDYKAVIAGAPALLSEAQGLASAAAGKKDEMMKALSGDWTGLAASAPGMLAAIQSRVDVLSKSKKPPAGVDLAGAKATLTDANGLWGKAQAAFSAGNLEEAVSVAKDVKAKADSAMSALKMAPAAN